MRRHITQVSLLAAQTYPEKMVFVAFHRGQREISSYYYPTKTSARRLAWLIRRMASQNKFEVEIYHDGWGARRVGVAK